MGLKPLGKPIYIEQMRKIVRLKKDGKYNVKFRLFNRHHSKIDYKWDGGSPQTIFLFSNKLEKFLGPARKK